MDGTDDGPSILKEFERKCLYGKHILKFKKNFTATSAVLFIHHEALALAQPDVAVLLAQLDLAVVLAQPDVA